MYYKRQSQSTVHNTRLKIPTYLHKHVIPTPNTYVSIVSIDASSLLPVMDDQATTPNFKHDKLTLTCFLRVTKHHPARPSRFQRQAGPQPTSSIADAEGVNNTCPPRKVQEGSPFLAFPSQEGPHSTLPSTQSHNRKAHSSCVLSPNQCPDAEDGRLDEASGRRVLQLPLRPLQLARTSTIETDEQTVGWFEVLMRTGQLTSWSDRNPMTTTPQI